jgi:hypothetical protein
MKQICRDPRLLRLASRFVVPSIEKQLPSSETRRAWRSDMRQKDDGPGKSVHPGAVMSTWSSYSTSSLAATLRPSTMPAMSFLPAVDVPHALRVTRALSG